MAFSTSPSHQRNQSPVADINVVPLIDVMLVLLVVFMVTAPLMTHTTQVNLPKAHSQPSTSQPERIRIAIDKTSRITWNGQFLDETSLQQRLQEQAGRSPQPGLEIAADGEVAYQKVVSILANCKQVGLNQVGLLTDPRR